MLPTRMLHYPQQLPIPGVRSALPREISVKSPKWPKLPTILQQANTDMRAIPKSAESATAVFGYIGYIGH